VPEIIRLARNHPPRSIIHPPGMHRDLHPMTRLRVLVLAVLTIAASLAPSHARAQVAPDERWYTFDTPHFQVHYPRGLEPLARRAAARAEEARTALGDAFVPAPRGRIHLVLADNVDYANGLASVFPRNRVVIYAHAPVDEPSLAYAFDWLELVVGHEVSHIHHLDYASPFIRGLRAVLGRSPLTFPNVTVPQWTTEGLATYLESRLTGAGRVEGTWHEMMLRTAILEDRFFDVDRATGRPTRWPGGSTAYVYGSMFADYLSDRYGPERAGAFVREVGGRWIPYFTDDAARDAYGVSFSAAWRDWRDSLRTAYARQADSVRSLGLTKPELLTREGRESQWPRYAPDGSVLAYSAVTGREDPETRLIHGDGRIETLALRTSGGPIAWTPDGGAIVTSQLERIDPYRILHDLYRVDRGGDQDRLTRGARLAEPDVRRDGRIVAVRGGGEWNALVLADGEGRIVRALADSAVGTNWANPRWSPDGSRIAVARWLTGGLYDVVVMDTAGRVVREVTADRALDLTPAWSPDGRYVLFSSDRSGIPNLYAYDLRDGRLLQVTNLLTGGFQPDVSPDGRWIAFTWYRSDGFHVARIPFDPATWRPAPPVRPEAAEPGPDPARYAVTAGGPSRRYSPWRTLPPTTWSPTLTEGTELGTGIGASVGGADVINRHTYAAQATVYTEDARVDGLAAYVYSGLGQPVIGASVFQDWDVAIGGGKWRDADGDPVPTALLERERSASLVATWTRPRIRSTWWMSTGINLRRRHFEPRDAEAAAGAGVPELAPDVGAVLTVGRSTVRGFEFSVTPEEGWLTAVTVEGRRYTREIETAPDVQGYVRVAGRTQAFRPIDWGGFARHAIGGRLMAAADVGSRSPGFAVGGLYGGGFASPLSAGLGIGGELDFPVRGYGEGSQLGDRAVAGSLEYRFPIALVERGYRLLPLFVDRLWGTAFADGGAAWCLDDCPVVLQPTREARPVFSVGAELGADLTLFFHGALQVMGGVALPLSETGPEDVRPAPEVYVRFGRSF
jgi:WD40-like Beta Propeller Repeat